MKTGAEYQKEWREKNPERAKEIARRSYQKNRTKKLAYKAKYYKENHSAILRQAKKRYALHGEEIRAKERIRGKEQRNKERMMAFTHYAGNPPRCMCKGKDCWHTGLCPVADIRGLTIDHPNNNGAEERRRIGYGGWRFYVWLRLHNYPEGYEVWCILCNFIKAQNLIRV